MKAHVTLAEHFWARVQKTDSCWLWTKTLDRGGYGYVHWPKRATAHRVSWELHFGEIPSGLCVCHHCDVRNCVRPDHLFLGTCLDNAQDKVQKGRAARNKADGELNGYAKLTAEIVLQLRAEPRHERFASRHYSELAKRHGVSSTCVREAIEGKRRWKHL